MEDCNYRLKWRIEDMQHELGEANQRIQTLTKKPALAARQIGRARSAVAAGLLEPGVGGRDSEAPTLPPAPGSPEVQPGREFTPGNSAPSKSSGAATYRQSDNTITMFRTLVSTAQQALSRVSPICSIPMPMSSALC